jgi:UDP:flavonoid glycosyltransferase YjiC (YdhE family)
MKPIIFLMFHGAGHFRAIYRLANKWSQSRRVVIAGHEFFRKEVQQRDFEFFGLHSVPFAVGFEEWVNTVEKKKYIYLSCLLDRWRDRLYHKRKSELERMIAEVDPDTILIDAWQSTDFVILYPIAKEKNIRLVFIHTMMPTALRPGLPPLNSDALPSEAEKIRNDTAEFHRNRSKKNFREFLTYFGKSNERMLRKWIRKNAIPETHRAKPALFSPAFDNVEELVLAPREFDFPCDEDPNRKYLGFLPDLARKENVNGSFTDWFGQISRQLATGNWQLIFCSFGTVAYDDLVPVKTFLQNLGKAVERNPWVCVVTGLPKEHIDSFPESDKMHYHTFVPQLLVLSKAAAFISHGGLNSIKEAIYASVPLLVYPVSEDVDHKGNAARVVYHQIGLRGSLLADGDVDIERKVTALLTEEGFRLRMETLRETDRKEESGGLHSRGSGVLHSNQGSDLT